MAFFRSVFVLISLFVIVRSELCPKQCDCDSENGLNRAMCVDQRLVSINVGVPKQVEVYNLARNAISELENFCFLEGGYTSIKILNLASNQISWVGLHAFEGVDRLTQLDLSYNRLTHLPAELFWDKDHLESLDLSGNSFDSLRNEPFLMHTKLQVLNLNNCRIGSLPERLFTRLPNLRKLDLSENYMITITPSVLQPMGRLQRLELHSDYWTCNDAFIAMEKWIANHRITYHSICNKKSSNMLEKIISAVTEPRADVDVDTVWNITRRHNVTHAVNVTKTLTTLEKFDRDFPASQAFIIGVELGLAVGILATYIWLRSLCRCSRLDWRRRSSLRRERRRRRRDGDQNASLLWTSIINPDLETPPTFRRQLSLPDRSPPFPVYGLVGLGRGNQDEAETPPPPYNQCGFV